MTALEEGFKTTKKEKQTNITDIIFLLQTLQEDPEGKKDTVLVEFIPGVNTAFGMNFGRQCQWDVFLLLPVANRYLKSCKQVSQK